MTRGRKPLPKEKLVLRDTFRKDRDRPDSIIGESVPVKEIAQRCQTAGLQQAPKKARDIYWAMCKRLAVQGLMDPAFCPEILIWSVDQYLATECVKSLKTDGLTLTGTTKDGRTIKFPNPAFKQLMNLQDKLLKIGSNFGMSPVDRARMKAPAEDKPQGFKALFAAIVAGDDDEPDEQ